MENFSSTGNCLDVQAVKKGRVEIDTSRPFSSVKAAVCLFGEKAQVNEFREVRDLELQQRHVRQEAELKRVQEQCTAAVLELELMRTELENVKRELAAVLYNKGLAITEAKAFVGDHKNGDQRSLCFLEDAAAVQLLELRQAVVIENLHALHQELMAAEVANGAMVKATSEAFLKFDEQAKLQLRDSQNVCFSSYACTQDIKSGDLLDILNDGTSLEDVLKALEDEHDDLKKELEVLRSREADASVAATRLGMELAKAKLELKATFTAEINKRGVWDVLQALRGDTHDIQEVQENLVASRNEVNMENLYPSEGNSSINASDCGTVCTQAYGTDNVRVLSSFQLDATSGNDQEKGDEANAMPFGEFILQVKSDTGADGELCRSLKEELNIAKHSLGHEIEEIEVAKNDVESEVNGLKEEAMQEWGGQSALYKDNGGQSYSCSHMPFVGASYSMHYSKTEKHKKKHLLPLLSSLLGRKNQH